jgi:hypothetical protein
MISQGGEMNASVTSNKLKTKFARLSCCIAVLGVSQWSTTTRADQPIGMHRAAASPSAEIHYGGVLAESYSYHRQGPSAAATITPPTGWYGYGFPVTTHRWGWFGAAHYYPTVVWQRGYMGDQKRWAYRRGY